MKNKHYIKEVKETVHYRAQVVTQKGTVIIESSTIFKSGANALYTADNLIPAAHKVTDNMYWNTRGLIPVATPVHTIETTTRDL